MGTTTTTYDVVTRYMMQTSGVGPQLSNMERQIRQVGSASDGLTSSLKGWALAAGGYIGLHEAKKSLIDYNSYMEQSRIQMAGLMAQAGSGNFVGNLDVASTLMRQMRDDAAKTVGTTQDYVAMASQLIQPLTMAGAKVADIRDMTRLSVVAAKAMGIDATVSARDIDQAIRGMYRSVDQFTGKLLTPMGYGGEEGRKKFNALSMEKRFAEVKAALGSKAIEDMARAQESTFEGVASTFESIVKQTLGTMGTPMFKAISAELARWNEWLQKNEKRVEEIATSIGNKLVTGLREIKEITIFIGEHWKELALIYASFKMPGMVGGFAGGLAGGLGAGAGGMTGFAGQLSVATSGLTLFAAGLVAFAGWVDRKQDAGLQMAGQYGVGVRGGTIDSFIDATARYKGARNDAERKSAAQVLMALARNQGITDSASLESAAGFWTSDQRNSMARAMGQRGGWDTSRGIRQDFGFVSAADLAAGFDETRLAKVLEQWAPDRSGLNTDNGMSGFYNFKNQDLPKAQAPKINVTISRIEVASEDPDRFAMGMINVFRDAAKNPSGIGASLHAYSEG